MSELAAVAPAFVAMAHRIVWANVATVDADGRVFPGSVPLGQGGEVLIWSA